MNAYWRLRVRIPLLCTCDFFCWLLVLWGTSRSSRKRGELCAAALAKVASLGVGRGSLFFLSIFPDARFAVYSARQARRSKTWVSATLHRQGPRTVSEARGACFGITSGHNRPILTLLTGETCAQTPLDRPEMHFRREPDFADAPETALNGGFRHQFSAACFLHENFHASP